MNDNYTYVGKRMPFLGNKRKATGSVKYTVDKKVRGELFGKLITSPHPHALIKSMDIAEAEMIPGVHAIITFEDIPKIKINPAVIKWMHHHPGFDPEDYYIIGDKARFHGEIIGAVAAIDEKTAIEAIEKIKVEYEVLPAAFDVFEAQKPDKVNIHDHAEHNISQRYSFFGNHGDTEEVFKNAKIIVEDGVETSRQHVMALEPLTTIAEFDENNFLTVWTAVQRPMTFRKQIAEIFDMPEASINVICENAGGFFGEGNFPPVPVTVALAKKAKRPVKLEFSREEFVVETPCRERYHLYGRLAFSDDGTLLAGEEDMIVDSGAYFNRSNATSNPQLGAFSGTYRMPNFKGEMTAVYTNTPTSGGCRGYGGPQAALLLEHLMDLGAEKLGIDRVDIRVKNFKRTGENSIQFPMETETQEKVMRLAAEKIDYDEKKKRNKVDGVFRRGIGFGNYFDVSGGQPREIMDRHCIMNLEEDGTVTILNNHPDGGMNLLGTSTQCAAESSGIKYEDFRHVHGETKGALYDMGLAANSGMYGMGNLFAKAGEKLKKEILGAAAKYFEVESSELEMKESVVFMKNNTDKKISLKELSESIIYNHKGPSEQISIKESFNPFFNPSAVGTVFADAKVDMETGEIIVEKIVIVHDCGTAINPMGVEGQLQGGVAMGYGYAMFEDLCVDSKTGKVQANNFTKYKLPSTLDLPEIEAIIYEEPTKTGPFGAKGVGMSGVMCVPAAIANALYDATGIWLESMPFTPEKVLAAIKKKELEVK